MAKRGQPSGLKTVEYAAILHALQQAGGVQRGAAELLGVSPRVLSYKLKCLRAAPVEVLAVAAVQAAETPPVDPAPDEAWDTPRIPCPLCNQTRWLQPDPYGHHRLLVCTKPPCIEARTLAKSAEARARLELEEREVRSA